MLTKYLLDFTLLESVSDDEVHSLLRVLIHAQLHGYVAYKLKDIEKYPRAFKRHILSIKTFSKAQYVQVIKACKTISHDLEALRAPVLLLKGAAYIAANKDNAKGRLISDIDILVSKEHLPDVERLLTSKGWAPKELDDFDEKYYRDWSHELPPYTHLETGVTLDIHHNLLPGTSGKTIDIADIIATKQATDFNLFVPKDEYLILHSAIHLLLNDDIEKGLRDCLDLHCLLKEYIQSNNIETLQSVFKNAGCEREFFVLLNLLRKLFTGEAGIYSDKTLSTNSNSTYKSIASDLEKAVFPATSYLSNSTNRYARFKVYLRGHLSKMPLSIFLRHITYKAYRTIVKKLFGEYVFEKENTHKG
jgi:hypothetical protein